MDDSSLDRKIKEGFENQQNQAPEGLWNQVSGSLDQDASNAHIDEEVKNAFEQLSESAPNNAWDGIERQLNIDLVWSRIADALDVKPVYYWRRIAGVLVFLLLIFGWFVSTYESNRLTVSNEEVLEIEPEETKILGAVDGSTKSEVDDISDQEGTGSMENEESQAQNHSAVSGSLSERDPDKKMLVQVPVIPQEAGEMSKPLANITSRLPLSAKYDKVDNMGEANPEITQYYQESGKKTTDVELTQEINPSTLQDMPVLVLFQSESDTVELLMPGPVSPAENMPHQKKHRFEIGVTYSYNNTWLFNNDTRSGFNTNSLIQNTTSYGAGYGVVVNYRLNKKSALSVEYFLKSSIKQAYGVYIEGHFIERKVDLNYRKVALLYERTFPLQHRSVATAYVVRSGMYGSLVKEQKELYNDKVVSRDQTYGNLDYGVKLAVGQDKTLSSLIIGYGVNTSYGLRNIFEGDNNRTPEFDNAHVFLLGGYINLRYKL